MLKEGFWANDPATGQDIYVTYEELESEVLQRIIKPIGGFIFSAEEFLLCDKFIEVPFFVKDWLPQRGKLLMYAPAKSGKSFLSIQMARSIASGEMFLGQATLQGKVLYLQFELGEAVLHKRLKSTGKNYNGVFVGTSFGLKIDTPAGQEMINRAMEAVQPDVLILDPLYKCLAGDENEASEMRKALDYLDKLIEIYNCSIVVVHHAGKDLTKKARGSSVLEDWVDSFIRVTSSSKEGKLTVKVMPQFLRHAPLPETHIEAILGQDFEFHTEADAFTVKTQVAMILEAVKRPMSPKEIFNAEIGSNTSVYEALGELIKEGKVDKVGRGEYSWVKKRVDKTPAEVV